MVSVIFVTNKYKRQQDLIVLVFDYAGSGVHSIPSENDTHAKTCEALVLNSLSYFDLNITNGYNTGPGLTWVPLDVHTCIGVGKPH